MQREPKLKADAFPGIMKKEYETKYSIETGRFMQPEKHRGSEEPKMMSTPTQAPAVVAKKPRASKKAADPIVEEPRMTGKASKPRKLL